MDRKLSIGKAGLATVALPMGDMDWANVLSKALFNAPLNDLMGNMDASRVVSGQVAFIATQLVRKEQTGSFSPFVTEKVVLFMGS